MITLRTAHNRGNARVWLDRASCRTMSLQHGDAYSVAYSTDAITLHIPPRPGVKPRRVAGTPDRPVVDLCSRKVSAILTSEHYTATRTPTRVTITGA